MLVDLNKHSNQYKARGVYMLYPKISNITYTRVP
jgi:hypothetical protein